jgi:hypothetical protein
VTILKALCWVCLPLALIPVAFLWPLGLVLGLGWAIARRFRPAEVKAAERSKARAVAELQRRRVETAIQMQLAAHGLPDTARYRALVALKLGTQR